MRRRMVLSLVTCGLVMIVGQAVVAGAEPPVNPRDSVLRAAISKEIPDDPRGMVLRAMIEKEMTGDPRQLIQALRAWKLSECLDLSDQELPVFFAKIQQLDRTEADAGEAEHKALDRIAELLEKDGTSDGELAEALASHEEARASRAKELGRLRDEAMSMLSARQRCEYLVFERTFRKDVRDIILRTRDLKKRERARDLLDSSRDHRRGKQSAGHGRAGD